MRMRVTTLRMLSTLLIKRSTRKTRNARKTESEPVAGINAMPTTRKSNTLQASEKKSHLRAVINTTISAMKMPKMP